jgi:peroxiredoxin Q/BCP
MKKFVLLRNPGSLYFKPVFKVLLLGALVSFTCLNMSHAKLKEGNSAPAVNLMTHEGHKFSLESRRGQWTILYFYPKADTPGCTKQACAFRDSIQKIRELGADVIGLSVNSVAEQAAFHKKYFLNFTLLADEKAEAAKAFGVKMPMVSIAKRWTFVIDPALIVRHIEQDVDPVKDAEKMAAKLLQLQGKK